MDQDQLAEIRKVADSGNRIFRSATVRKLLDEIKRQEAELARLRAIAQKVVGSVDYLDDGERSYTTIDPVVLDLLKQVLKSTI